MITNLFGHAGHILQEHHKLQGSTLREVSKLSAQTFELEWLLAARILQTFPPQVEGAVPLARAATSHQNAPDVAPLQKEQKILGMEVLNAGNVHQIGHVVHCRLGDRVRFRRHSIEMPPQLQEGDAKTPHARPAVKNQPGASTRLAPWDLSQVTSASPGDGLSGIHLGSQTSLGRLHQGHSACGTPRGPSP